MKKLLVLIVANPLLLSGCNFFAPQTLAWKGLSNSKILLAKQSEEQVSANLDVLKATNEYGKIEIVARVGDEEAAKRSFRSMQVNLMTAFQQRASPYAGKVSRMEACAAPQNLPEPLTAENPNRNGFVVQANEKSEVGLCDPKHLTHVLLRATIHCRELNRVFEVKILQDKTATEKLRDYFGGFSC